MQLTKRYTSGQRIQFIYVFLFGFFVGVFFMNLMQSTLLAGGGFLDEDLLYQMKYTRVDGDLFFLYVLQKRLMLFFMLVIFSTTYMGIVFVYGTLGWFGFSAGTLLAAVSIRYGLKGVLLLFTALFPQYLLYVPAFWLLFFACFEICATIYFPSKVYGQNQYRSKKAFAMVKGVQLLGLLLVVIIGVLLESYVNPILLTNLLKIF